MKLSEAIAKFDARNAAGKIVNRKTGQRTQISAAHRAAILSSVRAGLRRGTGLRDVEQVDIRPYLDALPDLAQLDLTSRDKQRPANAADRVRRFLLVVEGKETTKSRCSAGSLLPGYDLLYAALRGTAHGPSAITRLQRLAIVGGSIRSPSDLPSRDALDQWAREQNVTQRAFDRMLCAYEAARAILATTHPGVSLPDLGRKTRTDQRGVLGLPDLMERLAAKGYTATIPPRAEEAVRLLAPRLAKALDAYLASDKGRALGPDATKRVRGAVSRLTAELIRDGRDPANVTPLHLVSESVTTETVYNDLVAEVLGQSTAAGTTTLLRHLVIRAAHASQRRSPLAAQDALPQPAGATAHEPPRFYTASVRMDVISLHEITKGAYADLQHHVEARAMLKRIDEAFNELRQEMKAHNQLVRLAQQKDKVRLLEQVTLPQLVCIGLPALRRHVIKLRARYRAAIRRHPEATNSAVLRARKRYATWLRRYLVLAVMISDGLRVKNYAGALVGPSGHFRATVERDRSGGWRRLARVETYWRGFDDPLVSLKIKEDETRKERLRYGRALRPGIVDHVLLLEYWTDIRLDALIDCGLLSDRAAYNPDTDGWALFVSPKARNASGRYRSYALSKVCGRALHWICVHALKRTAIPTSWKARELRTEWRALMAAHVTRLLIGTYWGGIRDQWGKAARITDDTASTLTRSYSKVSARMEELMLVDGPENPHHFDDVMDRVEAGGTI